MRKILLSVMAVMCLICVNALYGAEGDDMETSVYSEVSKAAAVNGGVKEITYDQFMQIRNSGQPYTLLDVLTPDSYAEGHIDGALSFPVNTITKDAAASMLAKGSDVIVYCGSFHCGASTAAAKKLSGFGYNVLDYKGGLKEWQEKGNALVSGK